MYYYKIESSGPYYGTEQVDYIESESELTPIDENEYDEDIREQLFNDFSYLINGWNEEDPTIEQYEDFKDNCEVYFSEITKEQYEEED